MDCLRFHRRPYQRLRQCTAQEPARSIGLKEAGILQSARWFVTSGVTLLLPGQGLPEGSSGTASKAARINLYLAEGQIGNPGADPLSRTGRPNAMGGREGRGLAHLPSGQRDPANPARRAEVAAL